MDKNESDGELSGDDQEVDEQTTSSDGITVPSDASVLGALLKMGLIYMHYGKTTWNVFVSRTFNATIEIDEPLSNGVTITWSAGGPTDEELREIKAVSNVK